MSHLEEIPCIEVLSSVVFIIEGVVEETSNPQAIESHLNTCTACRAEVEHEQAMHTLLQDVLRRFGGATRETSERPIGLRQISPRAISRSELVIAMLA